MPSVSIQVPREINVSTRVYVQGSPIQSCLLEAVSLCSVLCWEKPRGSLARCECCSGFQGEIAGGCQAVVLLMAGSVKSILSRVPQWPPHLPHPIWASTSPCRVDSCLTLLMFDTPTQTNVLVLFYLWPTGITIWITSHLSHSQVLAVRAGLPLLPHPRWMSPYLPHVRLTWGPHSARIDTPPPRPALDCHPTSHTCV